MTSLRSSPSFAIGGVAPHPGPLWIGLDLSAEALAEMKRELNEPRHWKDLYIHTAILGDRVPPGTAAGPVGRTTPAPRPAAATTSGGSPLPERPLGALVMPTPRPAADLSFGDERHDFARGAGL